jgi:hypothetical protein
MAGKRFAAASLALVTVLGIACGKSKEAQAFDQVRAMCQGIVGTTLASAEFTLNSGYQYFAYQCPAPPNLFTPIGGTCPDQSEADPECKVYWYWLPNDPSLCNPSTGGCCFICEGRFMKSSIPATGSPGDATMCSVRWLSGQGC